MAHSTYKVDKFARTEVKFAALGLILVVLLVAFIIYAIRARSAQGNEGA